MDSSPIARRLRVIAVAVLAVWPTTAQAAIKVTGATIDGVTGTSAPPGSVLQARVTGTTISDTWRGTRYTLGATGACVNTGDVSGVGRTSR
jgi:hypothetical protein